MENKSVVTPTHPFSWFSINGMIIKSPNCIFMLGRSDSDITKSTVEISVDVEGDQNYFCARYMSAAAKFAFRWKCYEELIA